MIKKEINIKNLYNETLYGFEDAPEQEQPNYPAIIFAHGFYGNRDERGMFARFADALCAKGFLAYRFDFSGCGQSEGDYSKTTLTKLAEDIHVILNFVRTRSIVNSNKIGLVGFSLGATAVLALRPSDVQCFALIGSVAHPYELLQVLFGEGFHPAAVSSRVTSGGERVVVEPQFWADFQRYDIVKQMSKLKVPTLFLHGELDDVVPLRESQVLFEAARGPKELVIVPEDRHALTNSLAAIKLTEWFERYLK